MPRRRAPGRLCASLLLLAAGLAACTTPRASYSEAEAQAAVVPGLPLVRTWADKPEAGFGDAVRANLARSGRPLTYLALSGGGGDGAYGAGILNGWTEAGTRPAFTVVSGVSTGALIAPFAFLGSSQDGVLRDLYTSGIAETLLESPDLIGAVFGSSVFSNDRLRELTARYVTPEIVASIAAERAKGRLLLIVTTNLDSQRPVVWDMGAIASEGSPRSLTLFRDVLVASASIPAVFPAMLIDAEANGRAFQEMHVDGTVASSVYTFPPGEMRRRLASLGGRGALYVIMNAKIDPAFSVVAESAAAAGGRSLSSLIRAQAQAQLIETARLSRQNGIAFNLTSIDRDAPDSGGAGFSTESMRRLYALGFDKARRGTQWRRDVPTEGQLVATAR